MWTHAYSKSQVTYEPNILHSTGFHVLWAKSEPKTPLLNGEDSDEDDEGGNDSDLMRILILRDLHTCR